MKKIKNMKSFKIFLKKVKKSEKINFYFMYFTNTMTHPLSSTLLIILIKSSILMRTEQFIYFYLFFIYFLFILFLFILFFKIFLKK